MNDEMLELMTLRQLGMADKSDLDRLQALQAASPSNESAEQEDQALHELLTEAMMVAQQPAQPTPLLKERILVATEPSLAQVVTDAQCGIVSISNAFTDLCGYTLDEIRGRSPGSFLQGPDTDPAAVQKFREALRAHRPCEVELINYHKCGTPYRVRISMRPVLDTKTQEIFGYTATETQIPLTSCAS